MLGYATVNWQGNCSEKRIAMGQQRRNLDENCWSAASLKTCSEIQQSSPSLFTPHDLIQSFSQNIISEMFSIRVAAPFNDCIKG